MIYSDIYKALTATSANRMVPLDDGKCMSNSSRVDIGGFASCELGELPMWLVSVYLIGNTALSLLNFFWFTQMVKAVRKRFVPASAVRGNEQVKKAQ
jgi:hypothetical protein